MTNEEEVIIDIVKKSSCSVVSIIILEKKPKSKSIIPKNSNIIGGGSGFIISEDGLILTNRHVVADDKANYIVEIQSGERFPAKIIAKDSINDIAIIKIDASGLPYLTLGNSSDLKPGQTIITIGNALSKFHNSISKGIISGLLRTISTDGDSEHEAQNLRGLIQTDAAINPGNSGGPMLNTSGHVIGINAVVVDGAENISFAIPINHVKKDLNDLKKHGKIIQPSLGVRYVVINPKIQKAYNLPTDYGAWLIKEHLSHDHAVTPKSAADKAGIKEGDIILEFNGEKITEENNLDKLVQEFKVGDKVKIKILRNKKEKILTAKLQERI